MNTAVVYAIRNNKTGKCYVGSSRELRVRWDSHRKLLEANEHTPKLQDAWQKSDPDDWEWVILEDDIPIIHQFASEQYWIDALDSHRTGYNTNPKAGSYVSIDDRGYEKFRNERKGDIVEMLKQIGEGVPFREIANTFAVSVGFLSKLKKENSELLKKLVQTELSDKQRIETEKTARAARAAERRTRNAEILKLLGRGRTYREIAQTLGCSIGTVSVVARRGMPKA